jgi:hypothetical protein
LANDDCLAKLSDRYNLTTQAIQPQTLAILEEVVPYLQGHSFWILGESSVGKTPVARILYMMFPRYHQSAPEFDFFRGIFFDKLTPCIFDDGGAGNETVKKKNAFLTCEFLRPSSKRGCLAIKCSKFNRLLRQLASLVCRVYVWSSSLAACFQNRWMAAKFLVHQLRIIVGNQYNSEGQEGDADGLFSAEVSHVSFMKVRPAVGCFATADGMAILKKLL